jgi:hypothetical protein
MTARAFHIAALVAAGVLLSGCQTWFHRPRPPAPEPAPVIKAPTEPLLKVPKPPPPPPPPPPAPPKSCIPRGLGPAPRYPDTDAALRAAPGAADRYQLMAAGRILRQERLEELERAIAACR